MSRNRLSSQSELYQNTRSQLEQFLRAMEYELPDWPRAAALEASLARRVASWSLSVKTTELPANFEPVIVSSAAMGSLSYQSHPEEIRELAATFTFFMIYLDDRTGRAKELDPYREFVSRFLSQQPQLDPVLTHFSATLRAMWDEYDSICANAIVSSALEFVNGCLLERAIESWPQPSIHPEAKAFPYFLRSKVGVAQAYAFMIFNRSQHPELHRFMHAMPCIMKFIDIVNDILSFWKEELEGDSVTYVQHRASVQRVDAQRVLAEIVQESIMLVGEIEATLADESEALQRWRTFRRGYITFHVTQERYRLADLDLELNPRVD